MERTKAHIEMVFKRVALTRTGTQTITAITTTALW